MKLEDIGQVLAGGFGDRVLLGALIGIFQGVTPMRLYEYIKDDIKLGYWLEDSDWERYRRMVESASIATLTSDMVISELRKHRPDLLGIVINDPNGLEWFERQITEIKKKLGLEV